MIKSLRMLRVDLLEKARTNYQSDGTAALIKVLATDGTFAMVMYRLMQGSRALHLAPLEMVFNKLNSIFGNAIIGRGAEFGPGFVMFHSDGIVINGKVRGGANVHLHHQVTLGDDLKGGFPVLGDDVVIGAGAKIIGAVTIGDRARVGANAVVVRDVEPDTTVVGIPARPVRRRAQVVESTTDDPPEAEVPAPAPPRAGSSLPS